MNVKFAAALSLALGAALLTGCEKKPETAMDNAAEAVGDATDTRENEGMKDAMEDMKDAAADASDAMSDAAEDAGDAMSDAAADAKDSMNDMMNGDK